MLYNSLYCLDVIYDMTHEYSMTFGGNAITSHLHRRTWQEVNRQLNCAKLGYAKRFLIIGFIWNQFWKQYQKKSEPEAKDQFFLPFNRNGQRL